MQSGPAMPMMNGSMNGTHLNSSSGEKGTCMRVRISRPRCWNPTPHPTFAVAIQPEQKEEQIGDGRGNNIRRIAMASADKSSGVTIWDMDAALGDDGNGHATRNGDGSHFSPANAFSSEHQRRPALLARLPNHLSAVNVVRWEPVLGTRLASGSDMATQSIIIWKRETKGADKNTNAVANSAGSSSRPFGSERSGSFPNAASSSSDPSSSDNVEHWIVHQSLHGQSDIQDLAWAPIGLRFREWDEVAPMGMGMGMGMSVSMNGYGGSSGGGVGCVMEGGEEVRKRIQEGRGSQILASCSLDNSVILWNLENGARHHLKGHSGWVVGVSFDPLGQFLATETIDGYVWIWSMSTLHLVRKIRDVGLYRAGMGHSGPTTDIGRSIGMARISWTPDGAALVACRGEMRGRTNQKAKGSDGSNGETTKNARSTIRHVSVALNRTANFNTQCVFTGHNDRTTVSAVNPVLFMANDSTTSSSTSPRFFSILAIGSHDCRLSLWSTRQATPLLLVTDFFLDSILDLAWSTDGRTLAVSSHDGSVTILQFDYQVFGGTPAGEEQLEYRMRTIYSDNRSMMASQNGAGYHAISPFNASTSLLTSTHGLLDSPAALIAQKQQEKIKQRIVQLAKEEADRENEKHRAEMEKAAVREAASRLPAADSTPTSAPISLSAVKQAASPVAVPSSSTSASTVLGQQREIRRADGKRRIVPVSIPAPVTHAAASSFPTRSASAAGKTTLATASQDIIAKLTQFEHANGAALVGMDIDASAVTDATSRKRKRMETATIASATVAAAFGHAGSSSAAIATPAAVPAMDELCLPLPARPNRWVVAVSAPAHDAPPVSSALSSLATPIDSSLLAQATRSVSQVDVCVTDGVGRPLGSAAAVSSVSPSPTRHATILTAVANAEPSRTLPQQVMWESFIPYRAIMTCANSRMMAVACAEQSSGSGVAQYLLLFYSTVSGRLLYPPLLLPAAPFLLSMRTQRHLSSILVITCDGLLRVYDLDPDAPPSRKKLTIQASVRNLLRINAASSAVHEGKSTKKQPKKEDKLTILAAHLNRENHPTLVLSDLSCYIYDPSFECWTLSQTSAAASSTPPFSASECYSTLNFFQRTALQEDDDVVSTLQSPSTTQQPPTPLPLPILHAADTRTRIMQTLAQMESDVATALHAANAQGYRKALVAYVAKLVSLYPAVPSVLAKLREIYRDLRGPHMASAGTKRTDSEAVASQSGSLSDMVSSIRATPPSNDLPAAALQRQSTVLGVPKRSILSSLQPLLHANATLRACLVDLEDDSWQC